MRYIPHTSFTLDCILKFPSCSEGLLQDKRWLAASRWNLVRVPLSKIIIIIAIHTTLRMRGGKTYSLAHVNGRPDEYNNGGGGDSGVVLSSDPWAAVRTAPDMYSDMQVD